MTMTVKAQRVDRKKIYDAAEITPLCENQREIIGTAHCSERQRDKTGLTASNPFTLCKNISGVLWNCVFYARCHKDRSVHIEFF